MLLLCFSTNESFLGIKLLLPGVYAYEVFFKVLGGLVLKENLIYIR